jgi:hypothetical protein
MAGQIPELKPVLLGMLKWGMASFKGASDITGMIDKQLSELEGKPPQPPKPDPAELKAKAEMQKMQAEGQQKAQEGQMKMGIEQQKAQLEQQKMQAEMAFKQQEAALRQQEMEMELQFKREEMNLKREENQMNLQATMQKNQIDMETHQQVAQQKVQDGMIQSERSGKATGRNATGAEPGAARAGLGAGRTTGPSQNPADQGASRCQTQAYQGVNDVQEANRHRSRDFRPTAAVRDRIGPAAARSAQRTGPRSAGRRPKRDRAGLHRHADVPVTAADAPFSVHDIPSGWNRHPTAEEVAYLNDKYPTEGYETPPPDYSGTFRGFSAASPTVAYADLEDADALRPGYFVTLMALTGLPDGVAAIDGLTVTVLAVEAPTITLDLDLSAVDTQGLSADYIWEAPV